MIINIALRCDLYSLYVNRHCEVRTHSTRHSTRIQHDIEHDIEHEFDLFINDPYCEPTEPTHFNHLEPYC